MIRIKLPDGSVARFDTDDPKAASSAAQKVWADKQPKDTSFSSALGHGIDQGLDDIGTTLDVFGAPNTGAFFRDATEAPKNYQPASPQFLNPGDNDWKVGGYGINHLPRAIVEQVGPIIGDIGSRIGGAAVGGAIGGAAGSVIPGAGTAAGAVVGGTVGAFAAPAALEALQIIGPVAMERARNNGREEPNAEDISAAIATGVASGAISATALKYLPGGEAAVGGILKRMTKAGGAEGVAETAQSAVQQTGETLATDKGLEVSPHQAIGEGIIGAGTGAGVSVGVDVAQGGYSAAKDGIDNITQASTSTADDPVAAARLATRIQSYIADGYDSADYDPTSEKGAKQILTGINGDLRGEIKELFNKIKPEIAPGKDVVIEDILNRAAAGSVVRKGQNRLKTGMKQEDIDTLQGLVGHLEEGSVLVEKLKEARENSRLYQRGVKGGVSRFTDTLSPLTTLSPGSGLNGIGTMLAGGLAYTNPYALVAQAGAVGLGRAIDRGTGRRNRLEKFMKDYGDPSVTSPKITPPPGLRSLTGEQEIARAAKEQVQAVREASNRAAADAAQKALQEKARRTDRSRKLLQEDIANDTVPGGGFLKLAYDTTGLKPKQLQEGLSQLVNENVIDQQDADDFMLDGKKLLESYLGLKIMDRLTRKAEEGRVTRDPDWTPGQSSPNAPQGSNVDDLRRASYEAQAKGNQDRVTQALARAGNDGNLASAIAKIGRTNNRAEARAIMEDAILDAPPEKRQDYEAVLNPLVEQIRHEESRPNQSISPSKDAAGHQFAPSKLGYEDIPEKLQKLSQIETLRGPNVKKGSRSIGDVAWMLQDQARKIWRGKVITNENTTPKIDEELSGVMAAIVSEEMKARNASDWYSTAMEEALATASTIFPDIMEKPSNRAVFTAALSITSQNIDVAKNANYAAQWYEHFEKHGKFPVKGWGKAKPSIEANAKKFNDMVEKYGIEDISVLLSMPTTVGELKQAGYTVAGENVGHKTHFSIIFGPKIGGGFYQNLNGNFEPVTIDMWMNRTIGRMTGDLIGADPELRAKRENTFRSAMVSEGQTVPKTQKALLDTAIKVNRAWEKQFKKYQADGLSKAAMKALKPKSANAAKALVDGEMKPNDEPGSGGRRDWIRRLLARTREMLEAEGYSFTNADLQAILWYPEKRLWTAKLGARDKGSGEDGAASAGETSYREEFARIARQKGITNEEIERAVQTLGRGRDGDGRDTTDVLRGLDGSDRQARGDAVREAFLQGGDRKQQAPRKGSKGKSQEVAQDLGGKPAETRQLSQEYPSLKDPSRDYGEGYRDLPSEFGVKPQGPPQPPDNSKFPAPLLKDRTDIEVMGMPPYGSWMDGNPAYAPSGNNERPVATVRPSRYKPPKSATDPEGREIIAQVFADPEANPMSNEYVDYTAKLLAGAVDELTPAALSSVLQGDPGRAYYNYQTNAMGILGGLQGDERSHLVAHETGHAIDNMAKLGIGLQAMQRRPDAKAKEIATAIYSQLIQVSKERRPYLWDDTKFQEQFGATMDEYKAQKGFDVVEYRTQIRELFADGVANYLQSPKRTKEIGPDFAKFVRDMVNPSDVGRSISFLSAPVVTALAAAITLALSGVLGANSDDEEEEQQPALTI